MQKKISKIPFKGTPEQEEKLKAVIAECKDDQSRLMHVMPLEKVYGVSTFYAQFALSPKGKYNVSVCLGTACYVKGSQEVLDKICSELGIEEGECTPDGNFSIEACRCIGACGLAPVFTVNGEVYGKVTADDVPGILAKYREKEQA